MYPASTVSKTSVFFFFSVPVMQEVEAEAEAGPALASCTELSKQTRGIRHLRGGGGSSSRSNAQICACVCVCVRERERASNHKGREGGGEHHTFTLH